MISICEINERNVRRVLSEFGINTFSGNGRNLNTLTPMHYVSPHYVRTHIQEGKVISAYWRDGDGNTLINRSFGYYASNPRRKGKFNIGGK
jgi:hypothetical protein